MIKQSVE